MESLNLNLDGIDDPEELNGIGRVFDLLTFYSHRKAEAIRARKRGDIEHALQAEKACELTYARLPQWAKW